jgi:hypothetical protein
VRKFSYVPDQVNKRVYLRMKCFHYCLDQFHFPNLISTFLYLRRVKESVHVRVCVMFRNKLCFFFRWWLLSPAQPSSLRTTPCLLSVIAYPIYLQLDSISGVVSSICHMTTRNVVVTRDQLNVEEYSATD